MNDSPWKAFFKDNDILAEIDRDVRRTMPTMALFQQAVGMSNPMSQGKTYGDVLHRRMGYARKRTAYPEARSMSTGALDVSPGEDEVHWEVIRRMLFIFAKLNPGIGYVQGMNAIAGIVYYVMVEYSMPEWRGTAPFFYCAALTCPAVWAEPDAFFCFMALMAELRDGFVKSLDNSASGIKAHMRRLDGLLKRLDVNLWLNLVRFLLFSLVCVTANALKTAREKRRQPLLRVPVAHPPHVVRV